MPRIGSAPVTKQPSYYEIYNAFGVMGNEIVLHESKFIDKTCGCGAIYHTTLTDARLLIRTEITNCCNYCNQRNYTDVSFFLRDIAEIRQSTETRDNCEFCACCRSPKILEIRGIFGSKILHIPKDDLADLQIAIPVAIGNHKLISHH